MITKGIEQLVAEAEAEIETLSAEDAIRLVDDEGVELVDIRDIRELWREGAVPGAGRPLPGPGPASPAGARPSWRSTSRYPRRCWRTPERPLPPGRIRCWCGVP